MRVQEGVCSRVVKGRGFSVGGGLRRRIRSLIPMHPSNEREAICQQ